jgi:hypothetical protein
MCKRIDKNGSFLLFTGCVPHAGYLKTSVISMAKIKKNTIFDGVI